MSTTAKAAILIGILFIVGGLLSNWIPFGRLPGDFSLNLGNIRVYLPLGTSLLISLLLTLILSLLKP